MCKFNDMLLCMGLFSHFLLWQAGEAGNPFDSRPILIRLRAIPNFKKPATETSLVQEGKTPSSAQSIRVPRHVA